eukprot:TRINITY_DN21228_c0_g1_i4.p2 TRINITY_DN21228_c0_g1~~TRINITY_DN21228_c0_g1_i4.p2  ORF type:complete len:107 (+),score=23.74 TRINITY_DN21228_c0_g1_i4:777-1097(+)
MNVKHSIFIRQVLTILPRNCAADCIGFWLTREEKVRKAKLCVRSKQFVEDFLADEKRTATLRDKGIPDEAMRAYLQDPECLEFPDFVERLKSSKSFWEAGEEYDVG